MKKLLLFIVLTMTTISCCGQDCWSFDLIENLETNQQKQVDGEICVYNNYTNIIVDNVTLQLTYVSHRVDKFEGERVLVQTMMDDSRNIVLLHYITSLNSVLVEDLNTGLELLFIQH